MQSHILNFDEGSEQYRIGDEFGKHPAELGETSRITGFDAAVLATARVSGATGFYIGRFGGEHVVATNHHVCPASWRCHGHPVRFTTLGKSYAFKSWIGSWSDVDLALFTIEVPEGESAALESYGVNFDFENALYPGQPLYTIGYGIANNTQRKVMANYDDDCVVFSDADDFRFMADPDQINTGSYKAWSFANGCDVSHGDSGSAMRDRNTGAVVGLIWTGKIPKSVL
ncbi:MAG: serine protease [Bdellovibrionales bacterium]